MRKKYLPGVTLVEVLVAVLVLSLGIISAANCMTAAFSTTQKAQRIAMATAIAGGRLEEVRTDGFVNTITNITMTSGVGTLDTTNNYTEKTTGTVKNGLTDDQKKALPGVTLITTTSYYNDAANLRTNMIMQVVVKVEWTGAKNKRNNVTITTYMSDRDKL